MSRRVFLLLGALILVSAVALGAYFLLRANQSVMRNGPGMLFFYSPTCPICQSMKPILERLEDDYGDEFNIVRIDVTRTEGQRLARELGLVGQPNYVFFDHNDEETRRMAGPQTFEVMAEEIKRTLER